MKHIEFKYMNSWIIWKNIGLFLIPVRIINLSKICITDVFVCNTDGFWVVINLLKSEKSVLQMVLSVIQMVYLYYRWFCLKYRFLQISTDSFVMKKTSHF